MLGQWDPLGSQEHGGLLNHRIAARIPDWPNLEGHPKFTFSETPALPKETESMRLKLLDVHKRKSRLLQRESAGGDPGSAGLQAGQRQWERPLESRTGVQGSGNMLLHMLGQAWPLL
ncbi:hypothetical protein PAMP_024445 [Pampus punctatissimus]